MFVECVDVMQVAVPRFADVSELLVHQRKTKVSVLGMHTMCMHSHSCIHTRRATCVDMAGSDAQMTSAPSSGLPLGAIIGIVVGGVACCVLCVVGVIVIWRRLPDADDDDDDD